MAATALTSPEKRILAQREDAIRAGLRSFFTVAEALVDIRDRHLYRKDYSTFEDYCRDKWKFTASRARQLIGGFEAARNVKSVTKVTVDNERTARVLASLETPQQQATVWAKAVETAPEGDDGKPRVTAAHVAKIAKQFDSKANGKAAAATPPRSQRGPAPRDEVAPTNVIGELFERYDAFVESLIEGQPPHIVVQLKEHSAEVWGAVG